MSRCRLYDHCHFNKLNYKIFVWNWQRIKNLWISTEKSMLRVVRKMKTVEFTIGIRKKFSLFNEKKNNTKIFQTSACYSKTQSRMVFSGNWISIEWYSELDEPAIVLWNFTSTSMSLNGRFYLRKLYGAKRTSIHRYAHNGAKWLRDFLFGFHSSLFFTPSLSLFLSHQCVIVCVSVSVFVWGKAGKENRVSRIKIWFLCNDFYCWVCYNPSQ